MDSEQLLEAIEQGDVEKKKLNQYSTFKSKKESYESNLASSRKGTEIYVIGSSSAYVKEPVVVNATSFHTTVDGDIKGMKDNRMEDSDWNMKYGDNEILTKPMSSTGNTGVRSGGRGRTSSTSKVKVTQKFVKKFDRVYVVKRKYAKGGKVDRERGSIEWDNQNIEKIVQLQPDYQEWIRDLIEKNGGEMYQDNLVTELVGKVPSQGHRIYDVIDRMVKSDELYRNTRDNRVYLGFYS